MAVTVFFKSSSCRVAHVRAMVVICLEGATEVADLDQLDLCQEKVQRLYRKFATVTVMNGGFLQVRQGVVERAAALALKYVDNGLDGAIVVNGRGLMAVLARGAIAAYSMTNRTGAKVTTFNNARAGAEFENEALGTVGLALDPAELEELITFINKRS